MTLDDLIASLQATQQDKDAARNLAIAQMGFGIMGARRGQEWGAVGNAGQNAMATYAGSLAGAKQDKLQNLQTRGMAMDLVNREDQIAQQHKLRQAMAEYQPLTQQSPTGQMPSLAPTPQNLSTLQNLSAAQPKVGVYERLLHQADYLDGKGLMEQAQKYRELAEKYAPKYKGMETVIDEETGKPVLWQTYDNRAPEPVRGARPKPQAREMGTGQEKFLIDDLTGNRYGPSYQMQMTPGEVASNRVAQGNLAVNQGQLGLARDRFNFDLGKERQAQSAAANAPVKLPPEAEKALEAARDDAARAARLSDLSRSFQSVNAMQGTGGIEDRAAWLPTFNRAKQRMESITAEMTPLNRQPGSGSTSDKDMAIFMAAMPSIEKGRQVNDSVAAGIQSRSQMANDYVSFLESYAASKGSTLGAKEAWKRYADANPIFDPRSSVMNPVLNRERQSWQDFFSGAPKQANSRAPTVNDLESELRRRGLAP